MVSKKPKMVLWVLVFVSLSTPLFLSYQLLRKTQIWIQIHVPRTIQAPHWDSLETHRNREAIKRGMNYLQSTPSLLPQFVGANLACTHCHLDRGTKPLAGPWAGITSQFPQYRERSGKEDTLVDWINDGFERNLNGKHLPESHPAIKDILTYMNWLSEGYPRKAKLVGNGIPQTEALSEPRPFSGKAPLQAKMFGLPRPSW